mmetsp:Transcript_17740/g.26558  ORF Transcript_17740/g.26558 Transcript_17740/m.26558 type:complete len:606 (-) Transcript_17740:145-1962(-)
MGTASSQYEDTVKISKARTSSKKKASKELDEKQQEYLINKKTPIIKVDQIDQEQARQDLMAYLEIVGENADDLPLTWRDDPELGRSVSSLTAKQYAMKADAFIPCDVRVIATSCTRYGGTWELPSKENFFLGERAQDPDLTNGGAVTNSLLKVIYDFENDAINTVSAADDVDGFDFTTTENLFDDDEDDGKDDSDDENSLASLEFGGTMSGAQLSWSELLRRMKDEMEELEYTQVPTICTSRRFDLDEPVYLLPKDFNPATNKKFSLLVACNYKDIGALEKSHDDLHMVKDYIVNVFGFPEDQDHMTVLIDDGRHKKPTYKNILQAMKFIALRSRPGDAVFVHFSGHGGRVIDLSTNCYDEVLVPCDYEKKGFITDKSIFKSLLVPMAEDVTVTMVLDSCFTGVMLDMPFSWSTKNDSTDKEAKLSLNDNFSFTRLLNVVKQLYDTSVIPDRDDGDDSDGSIITMGGNVQETSSEEEDDDDDDGDEIDGDGKGISAQRIMEKIGSAVNVMADEAEYAGKTALKMYDMLLEQAEKRKEHKLRYADTRDDYGGEGSASYDSEDDSSYGRSSSSESEDSYDERARNRRSNSYKNSKSRQKHAYRSSRR